MKVLSLRHEIEIERVAEEIVDQLEAHFPAKHEHAETLPSEPDEKDVVVAFGAEYLVNVPKRCVIREVVNAMHGARERWVLKRSHQLEHGVTPALLAVIAYLRCGEDYAERHGRCIEQVGGSREIHRFSGIAVAKGRLLQLKRQVKLKQSITHVALVVRDHDEAIAFFTEKLLFSLVEDQYIPEQNKRWVAVATPGCTGTSFLLARPMHASYGTVAVFKDLYGNPWELVERSSE